MKSLASFKKQNKTTPSIARILFMNCEPTHKNKYSLWNSTYPQYVCTITDIFYSILFLFNAFETTMSLECDLLTVTLDQLFTLFASQVFHSKFTKLNEMTFAKFLAPWALNVCNSFLSTPLFFLYVESMFILCWPKTKLNISKKKGNIHTRMIDGHSNDS